MLSVKGAPWLVICVFLLWMCEFHLVTCYRIRHISGREMVTRLICSKYTMYVFFLCFNFCPACTWTCHWMEQNQHYAYRQLNNISCRSSSLEQFITSISCHFTFGQRTLNLTTELICAAQFHFSCLQQFAALSDSVQLLYLNYTAPCSGTPSQILDLFRTFPHAARTVDRDSLLFHIWDSWNDPEVTSNVEHTPNPH